MTDVGHERAEASRKLMREALIEHKLAQFMGAVITATIFISVLGLAGLIAYATILPWLAS